MRSPFLRYSVLRIGVFLLCTVVLWLIPPLRDRVLILLLLAATVSMVISMLVLNGPRDEMSARIAARVEARHQAKDDAHGDGRPSDTGKDGGRAGRVTDTPPTTRAPLRDEDAEDAEIAANGERYR
ncbi:Protein of unknown function [Austwickia chelonae]|uniref:DUF4229 domain-containing protein n=1 Tax=Austwickia chelonae NBRC 105200 TaxID=1184607 RepID=K6VND3_9MICO|nr:DUF4229 domain-containing protein [Austwickia chelonae]GAB76890.1 hypothetical protein AUCHE_03_01070 [Austwickia chelonae NBRC 105200]SEW32025.1 Protein of unknown function [Austwickia chelonae]